MDRHPLAVAVACYLVLALVLTGPAFIGRAAVGPDWLLDWDPLYRTASPPPLAHFGDPAPAVLDYPRDLSFARGLHAGRFDLWNPLVAAGAPLWAEYGPFFPLRLPFYAAPSRETYTLFLVLRLVFAAAGAYCLARFSGQSAIAALAAGAGFELSGAMLVPLASGNASATYMLPWILLGSFAIARRRTALATVGAGTALGFAAHGGHPTQIAMVFVAFGVATAGHMVAAWRRPRDAFAIAGCAGVAIILGVALGAASLLPLAELQSLASSYKHRPIEADTYVAAVHKSRWALGSSLFASRALGTLPDDAFQHLAPAIGTLALFLAITGALTGRVHAALLGLAGVGAGWALAPPGVAGVFRLPGLRLVLPMYTWPLAVLPACVALGHGIDALAHRGQWVRGAGAFALFIAAGLVHQQWEWGLPRPVPVGPFAVAGAALVVSVALARAGRAASAAVILAALMIGEQFTTVAPVVLHRRSEVLAAPPSPAVQFLQAASAAGDARFAGIPSLIGVPLSGMLFGLPDFRNMSALPVRRYFDYMQAMDPESGSFTIQSVPTARSPLLDLAAVRYFVLPAPDTTAGADPADSNLRRRYADDRVVVYENLAALPRARVVHRAVHVADAATPARWLQAFGRLRRTAREAGLAELALIEPDENGTRAPDVSGGASERERVQLAEHEDPDRLVITARLETPGFVVIADTYYPGWKAWLDGRRTPLFPANLLFRAVHVPAGSHTIELRYQPAAVFYGILLSTLAALASLLVILASLRRARRRSIMHR